MDTTLLSRNWYYDPLGVCSSDTNGPLGSFSLLVISDTWDSLFLYFYFWSMEYISKFWCYIEFRIPTCSGCGEGSGVSPATILAGSLWALPTPLGLIWNSLLVARGRRVVEATITTIVKKSTQVEHLKLHRLMYTWFIGKNHSHCYWGKKKSILLAKVLTLLAQCIFLYLQLYKQN